MEKQFLAELYVEKPERLKEGLFYFAHKQTKSMKKPIGFDKPSVYNVCLPNKKVPA